MDFITKDIKNMVSNRAAIAELYFNEKGQWSLHRQADFPIRVCRSEILTGKKEVVTIVTTGLSDADKEMIEGIKSELTAAKAELDEVAKERDGIAAELTAAKSTITELQTKITDLTKKNK